MLSRDSAIAKRSRRNTKNERHKAVHGLYRASKSNSDRESKNQFLLSPRATLYFQYKRKFSLVNINIDKLVSSHYEHSRVS